MAKWYLGNLVRGDVVYVIDKTGHDEPKKTRVLRVFVGAVDKMNFFRCRQVVSNGCAIWSFDYDGQTVDGWHEVVSARE